MSYRSAANVKVSRVFELRIVRTALEIAREIDRGMTVTQLLIFLEIASDPGCTIANIAKRVGRGIPSISRNVDVLEDHGREGAGGLGLVERRAVKGDRRVKALYLTKAGEGFGDRLAAAYD
jgi:DNA-binding MarR family transcriptional regulator